LTLYAYHCDQAIMPHMTTKKTRIPIPQLRLARGDMGGRRLTQREFHETLTLPREGVG
jgi:hypothetical protein